MVIQIASLAGTYSISFLVVLVNTALAAIVLSFKEDLQIQRRSNFKIHPAFPLPKKGAMLPSLKKGNEREFQIYKARKIMAVTTALLMIFTLLYGYWSISKPVAGTEIKVSLVQGNIEQRKKWDPRYAQEIMDIYTRLTLEASKDRPTMIIWPETATPGSISLDAKINNGVEKIAKEAGTYLLVGSAQHQKFLMKESSKLKYSNSAYLIHPSPGMVRNQRYDKIRLFPFGEYLPFKEIIPWTFIHVRDSGVYIPGAEFTIFKLPHFRFGVTICWENVFPDLFLQFVRSGAQVMVNITNEARFEKTAAPYQLASISVFRAVENRIFVIRCANTGVSCIINPYGQIVDRVKDGNGEDTFVRGVMSRRITPLDSKTIYTRYGDWFVWVAIPVSVAFLVFAIFKASLWKLGS
jgi:apolipoprotein N-acyltransferase